VTISVQSQGLSLLAPRVYVYAANQTTLLGSASGYGKYGTTLTVNLSNKISAGQQFYVEVTGADTTALGTGKYALTMSFAGNPLPTVPPPNTELANGSPLSGGGGQANAIDQEQRVNSATGYLQQTFAQSQAVATDKQGDFVVTWASYRQDGSGWGVYAQRFDAKGVPQGPEFRVNTYTAGDQMYPSVAMDAGGDFVITWSSYGQDGSGWGVYAQRYDQNGNPMGGEFRVNTYTAGDQTDPRVAMNINGQFVITWMSYGQDGSGWGIYAQRYATPGTPIGNEFRVNTATAGDQAYPAVAMDDAGDFVITWSSYERYKNGWDIHAQQYSAGGWTPGGEFQVNTTTAGNQMFSSVGMISDGSSVISWSSDSGGQSGAKPPLFLGQNANSWLSPVTNLVSLTLSELLRLLGLTVGGNDSTASGWDVYAQQFDDSGAAVGTEFRVNTTAAGDQNNPSVAISPSGTTVVVWSGNGTGDPNGVFAQTYAIGSDNLDAPDGGTTSSAPNQAATVQAAPTDSRSTGDAGFGSIGRQLLSLRNSDTDSPLPSAPVTLQRPAHAESTWQRWVSGEASVFPEQALAHAPTYASRQSADAIGSEFSLESPRAQDIPLPSEVVAPPAGKPARLGEGVIPEQVGEAFAQRAVDRCFAEESWNNTSADQNADAFRGDRGDAPLDPTSPGLALTAVLGCYHWGQKQAVDERKHQPALV
jgi:hypothetical protein